MSGISPDEFDPRLHSGPRIAIMSRLAIHRRLSFGALQRSTGLTSGNLASHLATLVAAGYVQQRDAIVSLRRQRLVEISVVGDSAFRTYVARLQEVSARLAGVAADAARKVP